MRAVCTEGFVLPSIHPSIQCAFYDGLESGELVGRCCEELDLAAVHSLEIHLTETQLPSEVWSQIFARLPNLSAISVNGSAIPAFVSHLQGPSRVENQGTQPSNAGDVSFKSLRRITMGGFETEGVMSNFYGLYAALLPRIPQVGRLEEFISRDVVLPDLLLTSLKGVFERIIINDTLQ